jgi:hypothetical protein
MGSTPSSLATTRREIQATRIVKIATKSLQFLPGRRRPSLRKFKNDGVVEDSAYLLSYKYRMGR